jgi:hypothetical protein
MRFMILVKATATSEQGLMPSPALMAAMGAFNEQLLQAGVIQAGDGLRPSSHGARVTFSGPARHVEMGPFGPPHELVAGFWLWTCASLEDAIQWVKKAPNPMPEDSVIEIRPLYEPEDFAHLLA